MSKQPKNLKNDRPLPSFVPGEKKVVKPRKASALGEDPDKFYPFRVELVIQTSPIQTTEPDTVVYYVRGPKKAPDVVGMMADQLWQKWEKFDKGLFGEYPDTRGYGTVESVDEDDFWNAWKEVKKHKLDARVAGDQDDPMAFTCIGRTDL